MKKRILIILILLLTTGCTCEYNLTIEGNTYKEEITLIGENSQEVSHFQNQWQIPIDKDEYEIVASSDTEYIPEGETYKYNLSNNKITFSHNFNKSQFSNSTAVSNCYNKLTLTNYNNTIVISTSPKVDCFDKYPTLTNIKVNIKVDKSVVSNNADSVSNNIYTWTITKNNANDKSINIVLDNNNEEESNGSSTNENPTKKSNNDYTLYIFLIILVLIIYLGYKWFLKFKEKNNNID